MSEKKKGWAGLKEAFHPKALKRDITQSFKSGSAEGTLAVWFGAGAVITVLAPPAAVAIPLTIASLAVAETLGSDAGKATFKGIGKLKNRVLHRTPKNPPTPGV